MISPGGPKGDLWILRLVAQSKNGVLPFGELIKEAKSKSKYPSIYRTLNRISPTTDIIPGQSLFCYDDFIKAHAITIKDQRDKELRKLIKNLVSGLEESYNHLLQWGGNVELVPNRLQYKNGNIVIVIRKDKNNSITLKLIPRERNDNDKVILTFRKKFEPTEDITKYTDSDSLLRWFALVGMNNDRFPSFKIRKQYMTLQVLLIPKHKEGKLYFRTFSEESYSNLYSRRYLDRVPAGNGQNLSMNIKGLLAYALDNTDYEELSKSLENLAERDEYQEVRETADTYNELGQTADFPILFNYQIRRDFPFLAYYNDLKQVLPPNFAVEVIKRIATKLNQKDGIKILPNEYLRHITTKLFFKEITTEIQNDNLNNKAFQAFRSEITSYLDHLEQRALIRGKSLKVLSDIEDRKSLLMERLETVIRGCENRANNEVIPIYEMITEARLSWFDISEVLKLITERFGKRYSVTDRCLIPKSIKTSFKSLLKNEPTYDDACLSLTNNGIPRHCISEKLFDELGFRSAFRKSDSSSFIKRKERKQRSKIHVYHDDSRKVTVISIPKK